MVDEVDHAVNVVRAEDDVDPRSFLHHQVAVFLGGTTADQDFEPRAFVLDRSKGPQVAVELVVGVLPDGACVRTITSASVTSELAVIPSAASKPDIRSESCSFIWHPNVRM